MAFDHWGYTFEGAFTAPGKLEARSGVYVIWCKTGENWKVIDVGESHDVRARVLGHDRKDCWKEKCSGTLYYSATYTPNLQQPGRKQVEQAIRGKANPACGDR